MDREEPTTGRPKMWRFIYLALLWAGMVVVALAMIWIETDGVLLPFRPIYWFALAPGPVFVAMAMYYRLTEKPGPL